MIKRNYITGDQLYTAYNEVVMQGVRPYIIARRFGLANNTIVRSLAVIQQMLAGQPMTRQKNRAAFDYALAKIQPKRQRATVKTTTPLQNRTVVSASTLDQIDPYEQLNIAISMLNTAIEELVIYEVDRQAGEIKKELEFYKDIAQKTNVASTLRKHFEGKL